MYTILILLSCTVAHGLRPRYVYRRQDAEAPTVEPNPVEAQTEVQTIDTLIDSINPVVEETVNPPTTEAPDNETESLPEKETDSPAEEKTELQEIGAETSTKKPSEDQVAVVDFRSQTGLHDEQDDVTAKSLAQNEELGKPAEDLQTDPMTESTPAEQKELEVKSETTEERIAIKVAEQKEVPKSETQPNKHELEPKEQEQEPKEQEVEPKEQEPELKEQEVDPKEQEPELKEQEVEPTEQEPELKEQELEPNEQELEPKKQELESKEQDIEPDEQGPELKVQEPIIEPVIVSKTLETQDEPNESEPQLTGSTDKKDADVPIEMTPDHTNDNQDNDSEIKNIVTKYFNSVQDINSQYVLNEGLAKSITHYFKNKVVALPLFHINMKIDRNLVKIPWEVKTPTKKKSYPYRVLPGLKKSHSVNGG